MFFIYINLIILVFFFSAFGQTYTVQGQVTDNLKRPLEGANIYFKGTSIGTNSGADGKFKLTDIPKEEYTIVFNYVGFAEKKITVSLYSDTTLYISLNQDILSGPIVTSVATRAKKRESAVTFSEVSDEEIDKRHNFQDIPELLSELPSTTFYSEGGHGTGYNYLNIRGFDQRRISVLINGIPQNDPEDHNVYWVNFPDFAANVQNIQVQRGASNAFYGPAAVGGSINIITDYFVPEKKINVYYGYGSYNTKKMSLSLNSGLVSDKYVFYGRASNLQTDGYRENAWIDFWSYFLGAARYDKNSYLRIHFYGGPIKDGLAYGGPYSESDGFGGIPKFLNDDSQLRRKNWSYFSFDPQADTLTFTEERRKDEIENFNQPHLEIIHELKINKRLTLNNSLFYIKGYGFFDFDGSWASPGYFRLDEQFGYNDIEIPSDALIRAYVDNDQIGWMPQLVFNSEKSDMILGGEFRLHRSLHWGRLQKGSGLPDNVVGNGARRFYQYSGGKDIVSLYFHQNYQWFKNVTVQADLQYSFKRYHLYDEKYIGTDFTTDYHFLNPRIGLNYNLSNSLNSYISVYNTSREPRLVNLYEAAESASGSVPQFEINDDGSYNYSKPLVQPENLSGLELGIAYSSNRFQGGANVFLMDFKDEIIKSGGVDRFGNPRTGNAERSRHIGLEVHGRMNITPKLNFSGNFSVSRNELVEYSLFEDSGDTTVARVLDGNTIAGFPKAIANGRLTYNWRGVYLSLAAKYVGDQFTDNFENSKNKVDAYTVLNFDINFELDRFGLTNLTLQGKINNLLDKKYLAYGEGIAFFPGATRNYFVSLQYEIPY